MTACSSSVLGASGPYQEGWPLLIGIRLTGLLTIAVTLASLAKPAWFVWASYPLPVTARWVGVAGLAGSVVWLVYCPWPPTSCSCYLALRTRTEDRVVFGNIIKAVIGNGYTKIREVS